MRLWLAFLRIRCYRCSLLGFQYPDKDHQPRCINILPASAGKLHALRYLMQQLGFGIDDTVFCGDSGNDMEILTSDIRSVLVANAMPEVRDSALNSVQASAREQQLYIAQGDFMGMNGYYSAGMLEGIAHFHPHTAAWMQPHDNGSRA